MRCAITCSYPISAYAILIRILIRYQHTLSAYCRQLSLPYPPTLHAMICSYAPTLCSYAVFYNPTRCPYGATRIRYEMRGTDISYGATRTRYVRGRYGVVRYHPTLSAYVISLRYHATLSTYATLSNDAIILRYHPTLSSYAISLRYQPTKLLCNVHYSHTLC
eukprot:1852758-Rhodomonas_salina.1